MLRVLAVTVLLATGALCTSRFEVMGEDCREAGLEVQGVPTEVVITGGPWTLEQSGASLDRWAAGYCVDGTQQSNPGTERMQPCYFPFVTGHGRRLQGYFDFRPRNIDEAIVATSSHDAQLASFVDLLTAEAAAEEAQASYTQALYSTQIAKARLRMAVGSEP